VQGGRFVSDICSVAIFGALWGGIHLMLESMLSAEDVGVKKRGCGHGVWKR